MSEDRVRVAAYAIVRDEADRVLLCHIHPSMGVGDVWTLPGGGLDFGEAPADAALRELEEETGYIGEIDHLIVYAVRLVGGSRRDEFDGSTDACRWMASAEAARLRLGGVARRAIERAATVDA